jgi:hypothetical protein
MSIQLPMMQPKRRLRRTHIHIAARIPPDTKVARNMQRNLPCTRVLDAILEVAYRLVARDVREQVLRPQVVFCEEIGYVAAQTARVVAVPV